MRKINLIGTIILIGILGFSIFIGNITKQSFLNIEVSKILNNRDEKNFFLDDSLNLFKTPLKYEELYSNSDTILKLEPIPNSQKIVFGEMLTKCKVKDIIKGEEKLKEIYVYEDMYIHTNWNDFPNPPKKVEYDVISYNGYNLMNHENEYILFLNKIENPIVGDNIPTFKLSYGLLSKYNINKKYKYKLINSEQNNNYVDLKEADIYFKNEKEKEYYDILSEKVFQISKQI